MAGPPPPTTGSGGSSSRLASGRTKLRLSLAALNAATEPVAVPIGATKAAITIIADTTNWVGRAWTAEVQWSSEVNNDEENWQSFSPAVELTGLSASKPRIPVAGVGNIRLKTTTNDGTADPAADVVVDIT